MAKKKLQNSTTISKFTLKNAEILFVRYLFRKSAFHCLVTLTKIECKKHFTLINGCLNLNEWFDIVLP